MSKGRHRTQGSVKKQTHTALLEQPVEQVTVQQPLQHVDFLIQGMHCASCEVLIERRLKKLEHVQAVQVNAITGKVQLHCSHAPQLQAVQQAVQADGYRVFPWKS
jgi:copper chaperone CopZ